MIAFRFIMNGILQRSSTSPPKASQVPQPELCIVLKWMHNVLKQIKKHTHTNGAIKPICQLRCLHSSAHILSFSQPAEFI